MFTTFMRKIKYILIGIICFVSYQQKVAISCECVASNLASHVDAAAVIVIATIVQSTDVNSKISRARGRVGITGNVFDSVAVKVATSNVIKANSGSLDEVRTGYGLGDCGVGFLPGHSYLIFADDAGRTSTCMGTRAFRVSSCKAISFVRNLKEYAQGRAALSTWNFEELELSGDIDEAGDFKEYVDPQHCK